MMPKAKQAAREGTPLERAVLGFKNYWYPLYQGKRIGELKRHWMNPPIMTAALPDHSIGEAGGPYFAGLKQLP